MTHKIARLQGVCAELRREADLHAAAAHSAVRWNLIPGVCEPCGDTAAGRAGLAGGGAARRV